MRKLIIATMAVLLSLSSTNISAQGLLKSLGKSIVNEIKKSANNKAHDLANKAKDRIIQGKSQNDSQQSQQNQLYDHPPVADLFKPAELPELQTPETTYQYDPNEPTTGKHWYHDWVDLGLPSGVRWSAHGYDSRAYMWGKISTDAEYCIGNCRSYGKDISNGDISANNEHDVFSSNIGRGWRMPRLQDFQELLAHCDREFITQNGKSGLKLTSRINGQSIFLSTSGYREGWNHNYQDEGYYWLSTSGPDNYTAHVFKFSNSDNGTIMLAHRYIGCHIYPVMDRPIKIQREVKGNVGGHDWVDLGLPSGTRWATCNVGATKPSQRGNLYAWGEIQTKSSYTEANCKFQNERNAIDIQGSIFDAAHVHWGNGWKMPTRAQLHELVDCCDWDYVQLDGRWVVRLTSRYNNEVIYLPSTGHKDGTEHSNPNGCGNYWSSTPASGDGAHGYNFGAALGYMSSICRYYGQAIRPVLDKASHLKTPVSGQHNDHDYVDLGLPSGTMWATCNLGAKYPDEDGNYYQWGEITTVHQTDAHKNNLVGHTVPIVCGNPQYDAATANWGSGWQTPTLDQFNELIEQCTWEWTNLYGRNGYKIISKINNNWIFLTTSGSCNDNHHDPYQRPGGVDSTGEYWSSTNSEGSSFSRALRFSARFAFINTEGFSHRDEARTIRPVYVPIR